MRAIRRLTVRSVLPGPLAPLGELATNLRWSWHQPTQDLFSSVDPRLWEDAGHDPVRLLGETPHLRLAELASDPVFLGRVREAHDDLQHYLTESRWFQDGEHDGPERIAYFSPEFGIASVLPQYSGGLGVLAGDHLKAASDLGVPMIGVGLLYRRGYFVQSLSRDGWQEEHYPVVDPDNLPLTRLREHDGVPARVDVGLPGQRSLGAAIWVAQVGRVPLLLLDSAIEENAEDERDVTDRLYGGGGEHRLRQELLLGIGGVRAVRTYCRITGAAAPDVFHTNEGHAGFLGLERIREFVQDRGLSYEAALECTRSGTVFTTHTPVPAGIDRFPRELVRSYFDGDAGSGPSTDQILALGAEDYEGGEPDVFNMAVMGLRLAQRSNGVSELHGRVARAMFAGLWPAFDERELPIGSITNGVHAPTWVAPEVLRLEETVVVQGGWTSPAAVSDDEIWTVKRVLRERLVHEARRRLRSSWRTRGAGDAELGWVDDALDPDVLTIGFARRVPSYKRLTLMLRDPDRLTSLLLHPERPVQMVIAGKAHPADEGCKRLIQEMVRFTDDPRVRGRIVFLPDYDIGMARSLYPGCDLWLNNPLRPYEACGTSGMKAALNGALNVSIRDGWWDEWFDGVNGWAVPSADGTADADHRDDLEAAALYDLIENEVAPRYYDVDAEGIPARWVEQLRHTLDSLGPKVQATRMVREYVENLYKPALRSGRSLNADFSGAADLAAWKDRVHGAWPDVAVHHVESSADDTFERGSTLRLHAVVSLGPLTPDDVDVQVVHGPVGESDELRNPAIAHMTSTETYDDGARRYHADVALDRPGTFGYTVRVVPRHPLLAHGAEMGLTRLPE